MATVNTKPLSKDDDKSDCRYTINIKKLFSWADQLYDRMVDLDPIMERGLRFKTCH